MIEVQKLVEYRDSITGPMAARFAAIRDEHGQAIAMAVAGAVSGEVAVQVGLGSQALSDDERSAVVGIVGMSIDQLEEKYPELSGV